MTEFDVAVVVAGLMAQRERVRREIKQHILQHPDDFDGREQLWIQHSNLRRAIREETE